VELSVKSLEVARQTYSGLRAEYMQISEYMPSEAIDLAFCNGVFHHIAPDNRVETAQYIARCLRPGGLFAFWENNPWNPGTRYVMSRIPFDRDAICLSAREAQSLLSKVGFLVIRVDYYFVFPAMLGGLRWMERYMTHFPLGAQYQVLCRKQND
jgi:SAM-dependent methyltransferase